RSLTALILVPAVMSVDYAAFAENASAGAEVKIVSFLRGEEEELRASELLEARVEGYDGNPRDLTYTWTDNLGTFLYVYNSHNMYGIGETDSEIRLGTNSSYPAEVYDITGGGKGFAWAAVSGANVSSSKLGNKLEGPRISVTVTDDDGNVIGTASYDEAFSGNRLSSDLAAGVYGIFEGDTINLKYLLGKGGIVHADCEETTVKSAAVTEGGDCLSIDSDSFDVTGVTTGVAQVSFSIEKANCQFHRYGTTYGTGGIGSGSIGGSGNIMIPTAKAVVPVCVFKRPVISTTATTLTISSDSVDNNCEYLINGIKGETADDGSVVFTGLTRNTRYEIEVRRAYIADGTTKYAYAYVYDDTKPLYRGTIETHLNGIDTDIENIPGLGTELYLKSDTSDYIRCVKGTPSETGVYHAALEEGTYYIYVKNGDEYIKTSEQQLIINGENRTRELHYFSVSYDTHGGTAVGGTEIYFDGQTVTVPEEAPEKEGYIFKGWKEADSDTLYQPGELLTGDIGEEHALTAQWVKSKNIKVNVEIQHYSDKTETIR
ncbi:MAG: InlB B-repeat-containing protein, partial [Candidatus Ornithomonoglobus sp.]